jgi:hypothetical protein
MIFQVVFTIHGPTIGNHDLKIIDCIDIAIGFLGNAVLNKIMGALLGTKYQYSIEKPQNNYSMP